MLHNVPHFLHVSMDEQTCQDLSSTSAFGLLACAIMDNHRFSWAANVHIFH